MSILITDYERIAEVTPTQLGQFYCPKCKGLCNARSPEKQFPRGVQSYDCSKCGRGWERTGAWVRTVADAFKHAEQRENYP